MLKFNDKPFLSKNYQIYTKEQLNIPGMDLLGHSNYNVVQKPLKMHIHPNCFEICFVAKGCQLYAVDNIEYSVFGNSSFITMPDENHGTGNNPHGKIELYWLQLNINDKNFLYLNKEMRQSLISSLMSVDFRVKKYKFDMQGLFNEIFFCLTSGNQKLKLSGVSLLVYFLNSMLINDNNIQDNTSMQINAALMYIEHYIYNKIKLSDVASHVGLSNSYFKRRFKSETGRAPGDYINNEKIKKAKELLFTDKSITEIAYTLGFSSSAYFSTVFKNYIGVTPSEFILLSKQKEN